MEPMRDSERCGAAVATAGVKLHRRAQGSSLPTVLTEGERHLLRDANSAFCEFSGKRWESVEGRRIASVFGHPVGLEPLLDRIYRTGVGDFATDLIFRT